MNIYKLNVSHLTLFSLLFILRLNADELPSSVNAGVLYQELNPHNQDETETPQKITVPHMIEIENSPTLAGDNQIKNSDEEPRFYVSRFVLDGVTIFPLTLLERQVDSFTNRQLHFSDLQNVCSHIRDYYRKNGYLFVKVFVPVQTIRENEVIIEIIESRLGEVKISGNQFYASSWIQSAFSKLIGKPLNYNQLLKVILYLNTQPHLEAKIQFQQGVAPKTTDILVSINDEKPWSVYLDYNNGGSESLSKNRYGLTARYGELLLSGDSLQFHYITGDPFDALQYGKLEYTKKFASHQMTLGFCSTYSSFEVGGEFKDFAITGESSIASIYFMHTLINTRRATFDYQWQFDYKDIQNSILDTKISQDDLRVLRLQARFDYMDVWQGRNFFMFEYALGIPDFLGGLGKVDNGTSRLGAGGEFRTWMLNVSRLQKIFQLGLLKLSANLKQSSDVLPSSENYVLGGIDSMRAFKASHSLGDEGYLLSAQWRFSTFFLSDKIVPWINKTWGEFLTWKIFYDYGEVKNKQTANIEDIILADMGVGLELRFSKDSIFQIDYAQIEKGRMESDDKSQVYIKFSKRFH